MTISASTPLRVVVLLTSFAMVLALLLAGAVVAFAEDGAAHEVVTPAIHHVVRPGDTLWDIATVYTEPGDDVRDTVQDIRVANDLGSSIIVAGQTLVVPLEF